MYAVELAVYRYNSGQKDISTPPDLLPETALSRGAREILRAFWTDIGGEKKKASKIGQTLHSSARFRDIWENNLDSAILEDLKGEALDATNPGAARRRAKEWEALIMEKQWGSKERSGGKEKDNESKDIKFRGQQAGEEVNAIGDMTAAPKNVKLGESSAHPRAEIQSTSLGFDLSVGVRDVRDVAEKIGFRQQLSHNPPNTANISLLASVPSSFASASKDQMPVMPFVGADHDIWPGRRDEFGGGFNDRSSRREQGGLVDIGIVELLRKEIGDPFKDCL